MKKHTETEIKKRSEIEIEIYNNLIHCLGEDEAFELFSPLLKFATEHIMLEDCGSDCLKLTEMLNFIRLEISKTKSEVEEHDVFYHNSVKHMMGCWYCQLFFLNLRYGLLIITDKVIEYANSEQFVDKIGSYTIRPGEDQLLDLFEKTIDENYKHKSFRRLYYRTIKEMEGEDSGGK
jgi:hypothetical protein